MTMTPERFEELANKMYPAMAPKPSGPRIEAGWIELPGGGWRRLPDGFNAQPAAEKPASLCKGWK